MVPIILELQEILIIVGYNINEGYFKSCYTYSRRPLKVKYYLEFEDVIQAILFEKRIKGWSRAKKTALINADFDAIQLLAECRNSTHFKI